MGEELGPRHPQDGVVVLDLHLIADTGHLPGGSPAPLHLGHLGLPDQGGGPQAISV